MVHTVKAKLFRWGVGNAGEQWKVRGTGELKLLHNPANGRSRLVMRREQVLKLCLNLPLGSMAALDEMQDRAIMWTSPDATDDEAEEGQVFSFSMRVKTTEMRDELLTLLRGRIA